MGHVVKFCQEKRLKPLILGSVEPEIFEAIAQYLGKANPAPAVPRIVALLR